MQINKNTSCLIERLENCGFKAYAVGGCVRDLLMGKEPHDWDICTSAQPNQTKSVFADLNCVETGIKHGTVMVVYEKIPFEITTMRTEGKYTDNRRPNTVSFVDDIKLDLPRRDFTINAMAYNPKTGIVDLFGGREDLKNKIIRCVGNADERFMEDGLRIMRALRFSAVLDFEIEYETAKSIHANKNLLKNISIERIRDEFLKLLCGIGATRVVREYFDVFTVIIPELEQLKGFRQNTPHHCYDVLEHILKSVENIEPSPFLRCVMLFHDIAKPLCYRQDENGVGHFKGHDLKSAEMTNEILKRLKFTTEFRERAVKLIRVHDERTEPTKKSVKHLMSKIGCEDLIILLKIQKADTLAQSMYLRDEKLNRIEIILNLANEIRKSGECVSIKELNIDGNEMKKLGFSGKQIGDVLNILLEAVIDEKIENEKDKLINYANLIKTD